MIIKHNDSYNWQYIIQKHLDKSNISLNITNQYRDNYNYNPNTRPIYSTIAPFYIVIKTNIKAFVKHWATGFIDMEFTYSRMKMLLKSCHISSFIILNDKEIKIEINCGSYTFI